MINRSTPKNTRTLLLLFLFLTYFGHAQIGIGTVTPNTSSVLDITSTTKGFLAPRMTTAQRTAIVTPAESLLVYDTTVKAFYYYNIGTTSWVKIANEGSALRNNYKLVKSAADLATELSNGGGTKYLLTSNTLYEINGTIALAVPIDLNDAYVSGVDTNEDILQAPGVVFQGATGGSIRNVTLKGTSAFNITGPGIGSNTSLLVQNTVIREMSSGVGTISGLGLYFGNIVQFITNNGGITYSNIGNLLLSNQAWFSTNSGTFERFTGSFSLIQKNSGFSTCDPGDVAIDVSTLTGTAVGTGILIGTVFSATSGTPVFINRYAASLTYTGYNFTNAWTVESPGIPREADNESTGDINLSAAIGSGITTSFSGTGTTSRTKVLGTTTSNNLFRFTKDGENRITYRGTKTRYFQVTASVSYQTTAESTLIFYIARNGVVLPETKVYGRPSTGLLTTAGIVALPIIGSVQMKTGDYIEIYVERYSGLGDLSTVSLNLTAR